MSRFYQQFEVIGCERLTFGRNTELLALLAGTSGAKVVGEKVK